MKSMALNHVDLQRLHLLPCPPSHQQRTRPLSLFSDFFKKVKSEAGRCTSASKLCTLPVALLDLCLSRLAIAHIITMLTPAAAMRSCKRPSASSKKLERMFEKGQTSRPDLQLTYKLWPIFTRFKARFTFVSPARAKAASKVVEEAAAASSEAAKATAQQAQRHASEVSL